MKTTGDNVSYEFLWLSAIKQTLFCFILLLSALKMLLKNELQESDFWIDGGRSEHTMMTFQKGGLPINSDGYPWQPSDISLPGVWKGDSFHQFLQHDLRLAHDTFWPWIAEENLQGDQAKSPSSWLPSDIPLDLKVSSELPPLSPWTIAHSSLEGNIKVLCLKYVNLGAHFFKKLIVVIF